MSNNKNYVLRIKNNNYYCDEVECYSTYEEALNRVTELNIINKQEIEELSNYGEVESEDGTYISIA